MSEDWKRPEEIAAVFGVSVRRVQLSAGGHHQVREDTRVMQAVCPTCCPPSRATSSI